MWTAQGLANESDVEQKLIYPLLTHPSPQGLALPPPVILTKVNVRSLRIGKGVDQKLYFPDYLIMNNGWPLVVIEAKAPNESADEGFRQARMYANELNALLPSGLNPVKYVLSCNGVEFLYGQADSATPTHRVDCNDLGIYSPIMEVLTENLGWEKLREYSDELAKSTRPSGLFKARKVIGGIRFQNEEVAPNTFGQTVTTSVAHIFNPESHEERADIVRDAYVPSLRRERYVEPIDRIISAAKPPSVVHAKAMDDSSKPREIIARLSKPKELEHKVLLLIGSVGSGKSTFVDYLQEVALPRELARSITWCRFDMNFAPVTALEIYPWLRKRLIESCKESLPGVDFDDLDTLQRIYGTELSRFKKGIGRLYEHDQALFNEKLGEELEKWMADEATTTHAHLRFSCGERQKLCVIVLDNCDKKTRDEQLLMFEVAQWMQREFRCVVVLPLRDETYDNHRNQPPLDTALKDMVFRIEPPMFQQVLMKRVQFALKHLTNGSSEKLRFALPNGFQVEYPKSEQAFYLTSILKSLFEHDRFARRMIVGLAGRNIRRALEIFIEFCNSGYIGDDQIFKIRQSEGNYALPFNQVATVILRMNRRFYDSDHSYIKNIFAANEEDPSPSFFCRFMILRWLRNRFKQAGTSGLAGYYSKREVKQSLIPYGLSPEILDREFNYLLNGQCIIAEHLGQESVDDDDLVRLAPAGHVHLDLVGNVNYLSAVSEDTFFEDRIQAERVSERIKSVDSQLHVRTIVENAKELVTYLEGVRDKISPQGSTFARSSVPEDLAAFSEARDAIDRVSRTQATDPWFDADVKLPRGSRHAVVVVNAPQVGHFVEFDIGIVGLVHHTKRGRFNPQPGDRAEVEVIWVDVIQRKMSLKFTDVFEEDVGDSVLGAHSEISY